MFNIKVLCGPNSFHQLPRLPEGLWTVEGKNAAHTVKSTALRLPQLEQWVEAEYAVQDSLLHTAVRSSHGDNMILNSLVELDLAVKSPENLVVVQDMHCIVAMC
jgi:hypothetical protein